MERKKSILLFFFFLGIILFIFREWFFSEEIIGGDWPYFFKENFNNFSLFPPSWSTTHGNGLGGPIYAYSLDTFLYLTGAIFVKFLGISWPIVYKIFWFGLFIILSSSSVIHLIKTIFERPKSWQFLLGILIYLTNTYILMIVGGGQMGIALSYSLAPFSLSLFIKLFKNPNFKNSMIVAIPLSFQLIFDPRIFYITSSAIVIFWLVYYLYTKETKIKNFAYFLVPFFLTFLMNAFWLFPVVLFKQNPIEQLGVAYSSAQSVKFFSFARFENSISLLHPNWPENIFGKTAFMKAEFLFIPIIAFSSLFFLKRKESQGRFILPFILISLFGIFLSKGANDPFGNAYIFLFQNFPGFTLFRDPVKWYLLIALSYSVLIPYSVLNFYQIVKSKKIKYLFVFGIFIYLAVTLNPVLFNSLGGTFRKKEVPKEYTEWKDFLKEDNRFYRVLWIPRQSRFSYTTFNHSSVEASPLFKTDDLKKISKNLNDKKTINYLSNLSIRFIAVPYDSLGEIFLEDRKYSQKKYQSVLNELNKNNLIKYYKNFGKIVVFEIPGPKDHFFLPGKGKLSYIREGDTSYKIEFSTEKETYVMFSENYSPFWKVNSEKVSLETEKTEDGIVKIRIPEKGSWSIKVGYFQDKYYLIGRFISLISLFPIGIFLLYAKIKK